MERKKYSSVSLPLPLIKKIKKRIKGSGFKSTSDYVTFVLRELLTEEKEKGSFSTEDREKIKARLRALGYLK
jgi:Arc/MetJ-type ribon-helix-helix transcriptional regulator